MKSVTKRFGLTALGLVTVALLSGCDSVKREEPIILAQTLTLTTPKVHNQDVVANYLGDVDLGDFNPELPTQRREGVYKSGKQEGGVWYWEFESKKDLNQQKPYNGVSYY